MEGWREWEFQLGASSPFFWSARLFKENRRDCENKCRALHLHTVQKHEHEPSARSGKEFLRASEFLVEERGRLPRRAGRQLRGALPQYEEAVRDREMGLSQFARTNF